MVIDITEIIEILKNIEWLESEKEGLEPDDIDYIGIQFEINMEYKNLEYIKTLLRSGG